MAAQSLSRNRSLFLLLALACATTAVVLVMRWTSLSLSNVRITQPESLAGPIALPYDAPSVPQRLIFVVAATIEASEWSQKSVRILPDDCILSIRLNGQDLGITRWTPGACRVGIGLDVDLGSQLHVGLNELELSIADYGGARALHVQGTVSDGLRFALGVLASLLASVTLALGLWLAGLRRSLAVLLALGLLVRLAYLGHTPAGLRSHDLAAHMSFIELVVKNWELPRNNDCVECHQPPLYYMGAAGVLKGATTLGIDQFTALQLFSLAAHMIFLLSALLTLERLFAHDQRRVIVGSALVVFWPTSIFHSIRIGNDPMFYALFGLSMYWLHIFWLERSRGQAAALLFGVLALLTKLSGLIALATAGGCVAWRLKQAKSRRDFIKANLPSLLLLVFGLGLFWLLSIYRQQITGANLRSFNKFDWMTKQLHVGNGLANYLVFDLWTYLKSPFINTLDDQFGRQFFWNFLLKSSLTGEFWFGPASVNAARALGGLLLLLLPVAGLGAFVAARRRDTRHFVGGVSLLLLLVALACYRMLYPAACNNDFRFILPALVPLAALFCEGLGFLERKGPQARQLATVAKLAGGVFLGLSVMFAVMPLFLSSWQI